MPRKTIIIFITVFIIIGALVYGVYAYFGTSHTPAASTTDTSTSGYQNFNPFGSGANTTNTSTTPAAGGEVTNTNPAQTTIGEQTVYKLSKLTDFAIAGAAFLEDTRAIAQVAGTTPDPKAPKTEVVPSLRYVERATGHIYERYLDNGVTGEISNSTIPDIYESLFDSKAGTVVYRYLEDDDSISTFVATLGAKSGGFLASNIIDMTLSPDKTKFFYLTKTSSGVSGTIQTFGQTKKSQFFSSSFDEWLSQWATNNTIYLTTKASGSANGYLYSLGTSGGFKKVFGPVVGLTTLVNKTGSLVLYSTTNSSGNPALGLFNVSKNTSTDLGLAGLPEKCIWSADNINIYCAIPNTVGAGIYPDVWYQGLTSFNDHFVEINTNTLNAVSLDSSGDGTTVDATHLFLDDKEAKLFFTNKKDSTLWSLDLK